MHDFSFIAETDRLILRPFIRDDIASAYQLNLDPEISRYTHDGGVKTLNQIRETVELNILGDYQKYGFGRFAVLDKETNEFIGFCGLKYMPNYDAVDIGYRFKRNYWGKGIATEAAMASLKFGFEELTLQRIIGFVLPENIGSIRVLEKVGMIHIGEVPECGAIARMYEKKVLTKT